MTCSSGAEGQVLVNGTLWRSLPHPVQNTPAQTLLHWQQMEETGKETFQTLDTEFG